MAWYYSKQAKDAMNALTDRLAKAELHIEELEATVSQHTAAINQLAAAVRKLQTETRR
jgi:outer membrane protein assembly factor BamD (BamD/ComL family)